VNIKSSKVRANSAIPQNTTKFVLATVIDLTATSFHTKQTHITHQ